MNINAYLIECERSPEWFAKRVTCKDGFEMSVQASKYHYCSPRIDAGPWDEVEVGYPSQAEATLIPYAEDKDKPTQTVYGYVPVDVVEQVIEAHGGLA